MKKVFLLFSLTLSSLILFSQENSSKERYKTNGLWDNWFMNIGGGSSMYFGGSQRKESKFFERLTWGASASVGKWFTPLVGARLTFQGGQKHTFNRGGIPIFNKAGESIDLNTVNPSKIHHMASGYYISAHADAMLNFSNLVAGYKENRFYNLIPYAGAGIATDRKKIDNNSPVIVVGLLNTFRINEKLSISLDISGQAVQSKFNDAYYPQGTKSYKQQDWDGIGSVNLGIIIGLGRKQKFEKANETVTTIVNNNNDDLNSMINDLSAENQYLKKELEDAKNKQPQTTITTTTSTSEVVIKDTPYPVQFGINSSSIESTQEAIIYNVAEFLKKNSNTAVRIIGLADKKTGSAAYNKALSKKRAQAVEDKLVADYGISRKRIISSWKGDTVQPYPANDWNRVVIITVVDSE